MSSWAYEIPAEVKAEIKAEIHDAVQDQRSREKMELRLYDALDNLCKNPEAGHYQGEDIWRFKDKSAKPFIDITYKIDQTLRRVKVLVVYFKFVPVLEVHVFLSYSHSDQEWFKKLREALRPLEELDVRFWCDKDIAASQTWLDLILEKVTDASAALLLVSEHFLRSNFIREHELGRFLARAEDGTGGPFLLLWVALSDPKVLQDDDLGSRLLKYQALLDPKKPLGQIKGKKSLENTLFKLREEANRAIYRGIRKQ